MSFCFSSKTEFEKKKIARLTELAAESFFTGSQEKRHQLSINDDIHECLMKTLTNWPQNPKSIRRRHCQTIGWMAEKLKRIVSMHTRVLSLKTITFDSSCFSVLDACGAGLAEICFDQSRNELETVVSKCPNLQKIKCTGG